MGGPVVGEVVIVPFPQSNLLPGKRRPAIVVAATSGDDVVLCQITSRARSDQWSISISQADFAAGKLNIDSFIRPNRLFTVEKSVIVSVVGAINAAKLGEVKSALQRLFA